MAHTMGLTALSHGMSYCAQAILLQGQDVEVLQSKGSATGIEVIGAVRPVTVRGLALIATRSISDGEELFLNYRSVSSLLKHSEVCNR